MQPVNVDELVFQAFRDEQLGRFAAAVDLYRRVLAAQPQHLFAATRLLKLQRDLRSDPPPRLTIVWQISIDASWESDWVRYLLSGLDCTERIDGRHADFIDGAIVVDHHIDQRKRDYYFEMLRRGHRFALFHLSDEHYHDDYTAYNFANSVIRNYWSRAHESDRTVTSVPLGLMNGFTTESPKPTSDRRHLWAFAGNVYKSTRAEMLTAMGTVERGYVRGTNSSGPGRSEALAASDPHAPHTVGQYAEIMSGAVFAPCPAGWENLDSFRVYEALEAGCIPIVERRPSFDYFRHLFGDHPMITIDAWDEAPKRIAELTADPAQLDLRRLACAAWWQDHKKSLVARIRKRTLRSLSPR